MVRHEKHAVVNPNPFGKHAVVKHGVKLMATLTVSKVVNP